MKKQRLKIAASRMLHRSPVDRLSGRIEHMVGQPSLHHLYQGSALITESPTEFVQALLGEDVDYEAEFGGVCERLRREASDATPHYPGDYAVEDGTAYVLYALVRARMPELAVEVGVADGRSTQIILEALDANNLGRLVSVDINDDVGGAATGHSRWTLRVHQEARSDMQLGTLLTEVGPPGFFFHDAAHTYYSQYADYLAAWKHLQPASLFLSDDVDQSWAFLDLAVTHDIEPVILIDRRKALGAFVRS